MSQRMDEFNYVCGGYHNRIIVSEIHYMLRRQMRNTESIQKPIEIVSDSKELIIISDYIKNNKLKF